MKYLSYTIRSIDRDLPVSLRITQKGALVDRVFASIPERSEHLRHLVAEDSTDKIIGYAQAVSALTSWQITALWVDPACRRRGIGSCLVIAICEAAKAESVEFVIFSVARKPAWRLRFLESIDFHELPESELDAAIAEIRTYLPDLEISGESRIMMRRRPIHGEALPVVAPVFNIRKAFNREIGLLETIRQRRSPPDIIARFANHGLAGSPFGTFRDELTALRLWVIADENDAPVGFSIIGEADGFAHIREFAVLPGAGELIAGSNLADAICHWALRSGYGGVSISAFRTHHVSMQIFRELGFSELFEFNFRPHLRAIFEAERAAGIPPHSRIFMSCSFTAVRF